MQGERAFLQIEIYEEVVVIGQYEFFAIFFIYVKQNVGRGLVHAGDFAQSTGAVIANAKTREGFVGGQFKIFFLLIGQGFERIVNLAPHESPRLVFRVDVFKRENRGFLVLKTVFLPKERHEQAVHIQEKIRRVAPVERVVGEAQLHLAFKAADARDAPDVESVVSVDHASQRLMFAPRLARRCSIFS